MKIKKELSDATITSFLNEEERQNSEKTAEESLRVFDSAATPQSDEKKDRSDVFARLKKSTRKKSAGIF